MDRLLSKDEYKFLMLFKNGRPVTEEEAAKKVGADCLQGIMTSLSEFIMWNHLPVLPVITDKGPIFSYHAQKPDDDYYLVLCDKALWRRATQDYRKDRRRFVGPFAISIGALVIATAAFIKSFFFI